MSAQVIKKLGHQKNCQAGASLNEGLRGQRGPRPGKGGWERVCGVQGQRGSDLPPAVPLSPCCSCFLISKMGNRFRVLSGLLYSKLLASDDCWWVLVFKSTQHDPSLGQKFTFLPIGRLQTRGRRPGLWIGRKMKLHGFASLFESVSPL